MPSGLAQGKKKMDTQKQFEVMRDQMGKLIKPNEDIIKQNEARQKKRNQDEEESLERQINLRNQIIDSVAGLINQIGQQIGLDEKSMALLNAGLDTFTQLATGDIIGAAASLISGIIAQIPSAASRFEAQIEHINQLLEEQARLIELSERKGGQEQARKDELELLKQKALAEKAEYERLQKSADIHFDLLGWRQRAADKAYKTWKDTTDLIEDAEQDLADFITGGITENTIADAVSRGFVEGGKNGVDQIADYMNDVLKNAAIEIFKGKILDSPQMAAYQKYIKEALSNKVLTPEEKEKIMQMGQDLSDAMKPVWDALMGSLDFGEKNAEALSGSIKGITEEQASVLAGQVNAIRIGQSTANNIMQLSLKHLIIIASNSEYLKSIDKKLDALKSDSLRAVGVL
jgi:hypothetical protein